MAADTSQKPISQAVTVLPSPPARSYHIASKMKCLVYVALAASLATTARGAVELSEDNFSKKVAGKNAFVKFLAPVSSMPFELPLAWKVKVPTLYVHYLIISLSFYLSLSFLSLWRMDSGEGTANP